jgi:threonine synthase
VQAAGSAPFYDYWQHRPAEFPAVEHPETLATAIKIGDPVSWPKAMLEVTTTGGTVESVTETEIADAKAIVGLCGIGCEPASAASLAGLKKLRAAGTITADANVICILTGSVLKDPDYVYRYHTGALEGPGGLIKGAFPNAPVTVPNDPDQIAKILG